MSKYYEGMGCTCSAFCEGECCCDADWTPAEVYELRSQNKKLELEHKNHIKHIGATLDKLIAVWVEEDEPPFCEYVAADFIKDLKQLRREFKNKPLLTR